MKRIIQKIKFFFSVLTKSLTNFSYYKEIKKTKFSFSLKYLFFLFYLISLIGSIIFAISLGILVLPKVPGFVSTFESKAQSFYPQGLVVNVNNGLVSTNVNEPYFIDSLNQLGINKSNSHFITIDTKANPSDIKTENTLILVTKDSVVTLDSKDSYKVYPIDTKTSMIINQSGYNKLVSQITPYLKYIQPGLIALIILSLLIWPFIGAGLTFVGEVVYLFLFTCIFYLVTKLLKKDFEFKKLFQLNIHGATLPILLGLVVGVLGIQMPPLLGSAILLVFMIMVINQL